MQTDGDQTNEGRDFTLEPRKGKLIRRYVSELARKPDGVLSGKLVDKRYVVLPVRGLGPTLFCFRYFSSLEQDGHQR